MANEGELIARQDRGRRAEELMNNPLMKDAFKALGEDLFEAFMNTPEADVQGRERIYNLVWTAKWLRAHLGGVIRDGRMADEELMELRTRKTGRKPFQKLVTLDRLQPDWRERQKQNV